jgi:hypothetical protein
MKKTHYKLMTMAGAAALALALPAARAEAASKDSASARPINVADGERRRGVQLEGMIGGAGCIPGAAACRFDTQFFSGYTAPSFGVGATLGYRAAPWLMVGGLYRLGMFNPRYDGVGADYSIAMQHTVAPFIRPILPIWRMDLGFNVAPGYGRQVFRFDGNRDRDYSEGFSVLLGPTIDFWVLPQMFVGAEIDFVLNTQRRVCRQRGSNETCMVSSSGEVAPTHQTVFGLHIGGTF